MKKLIFIVIVLITTHSLLPQVISPRKYSKLNVNNISTWFGWNGVNDMKPNMALSSFEFPKGSNKFCFFNTGLIFVGKFDNELRAGGSWYRSSLTPGWIEDNNSPADTSNPKVRIYRSRKNFMTDDLSFEANDEGLEISKLKENYQKDQKEWPAEKGAPYEDVNNDGRYTYGIDIPGIPGAYQTIWYACNDFDHGSTNIYESKFTNVEVQLTAWVYKNEELFNDCIFKKYKIINRNQNQTIKEMYVGFFADPDIGNGGNDLLGCDSTFSYGFVYKGSDTDIEYGQYVPATAVILLQGPVVEDQNSYGIINGNKIAGYKNLGMTSLSSILPGDISPLEDPDNNYLRIFNNMLHGLSYHGFDRINPITKQKTNYLYSGNPLTKIGWVDSDALDKNFYLSSGPFDLKPNGVQEITFAQLVAQGRIRDGGLLLMINQVVEIQNAFIDSLYRYPHLEKIREDLVPEYFHLSQNYPNPFNPTTRIEYDLPVKGYVKLEIYNILGQKVDELVDGEREPGRYSVEFNSKNLASGVYIYTVRAREYIKSRKMLLIK